MGISKNIPGNDNMIWEGRRERNQEEGGANQAQVEVSGQVGEGNDNRKRDLLDTETKIIN